MNKFTSMLAGASMLAIAGSVSAEPMALSDTQMDGVSAGNIPLFTPEIRVGDILRVGVDEIRVADILRVGVDEIRVADILRVGVDEIRVGDIRIGTPVGTPM